jgi:hypothetical protein
VSKKIRLHAPETKLQEKYPEFDIHVSRRNELFEQGNLVAVVNSQQMW